MNIAEIVRLSDLLGELGSVDRATKLPSGRQETDSHHSFSLALVAYHICQRYCPELDSNKAVLYALAHDLLEVVTGDEDTLHYDAAALAAKQQRELAAKSDFDQLFKDYPDLRTALDEYERLDTPEAATVFVLDKACTTWTHFHDGAKHARRARNLHKQADIEAWAERQRRKIATRLKVQAPPAVMDIYEASFEALKGLYEA